MHLCTLVNVMTNHGTTTRQHLGQVWCSKTQTRLRQIPECSAFILAQQSGQDVQEKVHCSIWMKYPPLPIDINVGLRLCPSFKFCPHCVFQFDAPALKGETVSLPSHPSWRDVLRGVGGRLRHVGVAVGGVEEAEGGRRAGGGGGDQRRQVGVGVAAEHEAAKGVAVGQDHHRLHQLGQRPALLARLQQRLDTKTRVEAGP